MAAAVGKATTQAVKAATPLAASFSVGQTIRGKASSYTLREQLNKNIWKASTQKYHDVIVKTGMQWQLRNESALLKRFQYRTPNIRPIIDEVEGTSELLAIVLKHLDDDMLRASNARRLRRKEVKYVAKGVLDALKVLHEGGYAHTDIKPSNILVNYSTSATRFSDIQLADLGDSLPIDSEYLKEGEEMGTPVFRAPEAQLSLALGPPMDIWSFGATLISLMYGDDFYIFEPPVKSDHENYHLEILLKHNRIFGPWPASYSDLCDDARLAILTYTMKASPAETLKTFSRIRESELCKENKEFVFKIMKLDPRDRPTAHQLLQDAWFEDVGVDEDVQLLEDVQESQLLNLA